MRGRVTDIDRGWTALLKAAAADPHVVTVGLQGEKGDEEHSATGMTNAHLASVHEFGAVIRVKGHDITIPERSFIRATVDKHNNYQKEIRQLGEQLIRGRIPDIVTALKLLGEKISSDIKGAIEKGLKPANAPRTIAAKGSSVPLIDSAQMKNAITYDVHRDDGRNKAVAGNSK